jgi:peptidoglycan/xylan/chitin deacetylase (PgdA/CDA1 family)
MKRAIKLAISVICFAAISLAGLVTGRNRQFVILYYHAVPPHLRARFARQLDALKECASVVPADYAGDVESNRRLAAITFDDAFVSVIDVALPELAMRGMPSTIFVPSGALGSSPSWEMEGDAVDRGETVASEQILRAVVSHLVSLGAHSVSHPDLTRIGQSAAREEIACSRSELEHKIGVPIELFAFPYGEHDAETVTMCREAGYRHAYTVVPQNIDSSRGDFLRGRISVSPADSALEFWLKIRGGYLWMRYASALKRALAGHGSARDLDGRSASGA